MAHLESDWAAADPLRSALVSTIIPTLNEERHIQRAITSVAGLGPVFVVDCGSTDATRTIAERFGATVVEHPWEGYSAQKNWALANLPLQTPWVLCLDADEFLTARLQSEIRAAVATTELAGFYLARRNIFLGRMLKHANWYPDYQLRLFRVGRGRFEERLVHEHVIVDGTAGFLRTPLMHENLNGIDAFQRRHERYASLEAQEILQARRNQIQAEGRSRFFGSWPERRRALKTRVWYRLPGRPAIRFFWMYVIKRGFLDGRQGLVYCQLLAAYDALIDAKLLEFEQGADQQQPR